MPGTGALAIASAKSFLGSVPGIPLDETPSHPGEQANCVPHCGDLAPWLVYTIWGIAAFLIVAVVVVIVIAIARSL